jgi:hypothetical protein
MSNNFINRSLQGGLSGIQDDMASPGGLTNLPEIVQRSNQDPYSKTAAMSPHDLNNQQNGVSLTNLLTNINVQKKYSNRAVNAPYN